jgi:tetratricopeptide (TPR) repeat protein
MIMNFRQSLSPLVFCLLIMLLAGCNSPEQKAAHYIKRGNALFEQGELEKARIEYKNAARLQPTAAEPFYRLGLVDEEEGDLRNAFGGFTAAEEQNSHFHPAVLKVAQYYMAAERYDETRKRIDAVLSETPDDAEAHALSAALLLREKDFVHSEEEARQALAKEPENISASAALTGLYSAEGDFDKAVAAVNDGIARNPRTLSLLMLRIVLYGHMDDLPHVAESYQDVFKLKPNETHFRTDLTDIYIKQGKLDEAEAVLRQGVTALPDNWEMKHQLVLFLGEHRSLDIAEKEIKDLMQAYPKRDDLYFWLADLYASHDATDKAVTLLEQIVSHGEFDPPALNARAALARLDIKRGNKDLAEKLVATVLAKDPDNRAALLIRANLAFENGYTQSAVSDLRTIVRDTPNDSEALQLLGETLLLQGHLDLAIDTMKKLVDIDPANMAARVRLAQTVYLNGDPKQAMELVTLVTQAAPDYPVGWETAARFAIDAQEWLPAEAAIKQLDKLRGQHLTSIFLEGQILSKNNKNEEAIEKYSEIINVDPTTPLAEHALRALVESYGKMDRMAAAASYLETLKTDSPFVLTMLGTCYTATGKMNDSAASFDKAIAANADFPDPYIARAKLYVNAHNAEQAIDVLKKGTQAAPGDFRAPMMEAVLLGQTGKIQEAIVLYGDMLARNPGLDAAANNLAEIIADYQFNDSSALEKARQTAERFLSSNNPLLLDTLAWVTFRQGNIPLAQTIMERALAHGNQTPPQMHFHYGAILMKSGKIDKAKAELKQALIDGADYPDIQEAKKIMDSQ